MIDNEKKCLIVSNRSVFWAKNESKRATKERIMGIRAKGATEKLNQLEISIFVT